MTRSRLPFVALALGIAWMMKSFYSRAGAGDLWWLLAPTVRVAEALSGATFEHEAGSGWVDHAHRMIVGAGCSGMNFLIIAFLTIGCACVRRVPGGAARALCLAGSLPAAWALTVAANAVRIALALGTMSPEPAAAGILTAQRLHAATGAIVYCLSIALAHLAVERLLDRFTGGAAPSPMQTAAPLGWYLAVVLGAPLLGRSWRRDPGLFLEHAALVVAAALFVAGSLAGARAAWRAAARGGRTS